MQFKKMEKVGAGQFIHRYDLTYETKDFREKKYEIISRKSNLSDIEQIKNAPSDGVVMVIHDETGEKILLNREFRLSVGDWVMNFPAGLIDEGESPEEAAIRELKEETGLDLIKITDVLPASFSAIGFSDEKNTCVVGVASGSFSESNSVFEEISARFYSRQEVSELLKTQVFAGRTQSYCYIWSKNP